MCSFNLIWLAFLYFCCTTVYGEPRIFNGQNVTIADYPFQAEIFSENDFAQCGAVIISKNFLLTAAHCVQTGFTYVRIKSDLLASGGETIKIKRMIKHPQFDSDVSREFDFGLVELEREIEFDEFGQAIALMQPKDSFPQPNTLVDVTGFGVYSNEHHRPSPTLRHIAVPINTYEDCKKRFPQFSRNMFCAGMDTDMDSAQGDSGGPAVLRFPDGSRKLMGITSFGSEVLGRGDPGFYGYVPVIVEWVRQVTGDSSL